MSVAGYDLKSPDDFPRWEFAHIDVEYDSNTLAFWMKYKADSPPYYAFQTLLDMACVRESLKRMFDSGLVERFPIRYFVMGSNKKAVYSLGGDLANFTACIRSGDHARLLKYAHACVDLIYSLTQDLDLPVVSLSAVHGQCLGGGFEAALASDFILAEETTKFGVPESTFNAFPGMGAVTLLTRRLGTALSELIIGTGAVYSAQQMLEFGAIDRLAPEGTLRKVADAWMLEGGEERWLRRRMLADARRRYFPVTREELIRITDLWAECSAALGEQDLRHMERLVSAQKRLATH